MDLERIEKYFILNNQKPTKDVNDAYSCIDQAIFLDQKYEVDCPSLQHKIKLDKKEQSIKNHLLVCKAIRKGQDRKIYFCFFKIYHMFNTEQERNNHTLICPFYQNNPYLKNFSFNQEIFNIQHEIALKEYFIKGENVEIQNQIQTQQQEYAMKMNQQNKQIKKNSESKFQQNDSKTNINIYKTIQENQNDKSRIYAIQIIMDSYKSQIYISRIDNIIFPQRKNQQDLDFLFSIQILWQNYGRYTELIQIIFNKEKEKNFQTIYQNSLISEFVLVDQQQENCNLQEIKNQFFQHFDLFTVGIAIQNENIYLLVTKQTTLFNQFLTGDIAILQLNVPVFDFQIHQHMTLKIFKQQNDRNSLQQMMKQIQQITQQQQDKLLQEKNQYQQQINQIQHKTEILQEKISNLQQEIQNIQQQKSFENQQINLTITENKKKIIELKEQINKLQLKIQLQVEKIFKINNEVSDDVNFQYEKIDQEMETLNQNFKFQVQIFENEQYENNPQFKSALEEYEKKKNLIQELQTNNKQYENKIYHLQKIIKKKKKLFIEIDSKLQSEKENIQQMQITQQQISEEELECRICKICYNIEAVVVNIPCGCLICCGQCFQIGYNVLQTEICLICGQVVSASVEMQ